MIRYTVLIPNASSPAALGALLPRLARVLDELLLPYEIICVDDRGAPSASVQWGPLLADFIPLRVLQFDGPRGTSAALTAGINAARGELILAIRFGGQLPFEKFPHLIARLSKHDLVVGRRAPSLGERARSTFSPLARWLVARPELQPSEELFWAARREAVWGLALGPGVFRLLGEFVAHRGRRVCELVFSDDRPPRGAAVRSNSVGRLALRLLRRQFEPHLARELILGARAPRWQPACAERGALRQAPAAELVPLESPQRDSA
jgi:Glycosyl transferase family 2